LTSITTSTIALTNKKSPKSSWFWEDFTLVDYKSTINKASKLGITKIYLNIEHQLYIKANSNYHLKSLNDYSIALKSFIAYSSSLNISVHGMLGGNDFSHLSNKTLVTQTIDYIAQFNKENHNQLTGFHIDFEFYTHPSFASNKTIQTEQYFDTLTFIGKWLGIQRSIYPKFQFSQALPFALFDNQIFPRIKHNQQELFFLAHINNILGDSNLNYLTIMAYRNIATGINSIIEITTPIEDYLSKSKSKLGFEIAVETAKVQPSSTSFFNYSDFYLNTQLSYVDLYYKTKSNYSGLAIHDIHSLVVR
jgi:hypothetical protein